MESIQPSLLHHITVVHAGNQRTSAATTHCDRRGEVVDVAGCAGCAYARGRVGDEAVLCLSTPRAQSALPHTVAAVMTCEVICVREDVDLRTVGWLLTHHKINGVPVVDENRRPRGIVTRTDLVRAAGEMRLENEAFVDSFDPVRAEPPLRTAGALMSEAITVREHDTLGVVARLFRERRCHAAPVVGDDGRLVGVVSAFDLLRGLPELARPATTF